MQSYAYAAPETVDQVVAVLQEHAQAGTRAQLLAGGTEQRIELGGPVKLTIGDGDAVSLEVADVVYEDLGRPGQVVHTEVRSDGLVFLGTRVRDE